MATKACFLSLNDKQNTIFNNDTSNEQYKNLNLNRNHQNSSDAFFESSKKDVVFKMAKVSNFDFSNNDKSKAYKNSHSWKKSTKDSPLNFGINCYDEEKELKKDKSSNPKNNSTLSLHIAAYENEIEETKSALFVEAKEPSKQIFKKLDFIDPLSAFQNPFEFPRQQESNEWKNPEVTQYKSSQRLLNPNQLYQTNYQQPSPQQYNNKMPVPSGYQTYGGGHQGPTCFQKLKMGFMMGAMIGGATGVLLGSFAAWRMGLRGTEMVKQIGKVAGSSGGSFGVFMTVAQGLRC
uniref:Reactive oxygen species modulator 1 n=1 Tax=Panagrolaimus sp. PS1159 TaxID=55785 RepID=A0AC35F220_9BILA